VKLRFGRIALAAVLAEVLGVLALVVLVATFGPSEFKAAQPFAERLGVWVGPLSGFLLCTAGGYWVARSGRPYYLENGIAMGLAGAFVDAASAVALGASFHILLVISNLGRVAGGFLGGLLASRSASSGGAPGVAAERSSKSR
jgi:hypothetical protein